MIVNIDSFGGGDGRFFKRNFIVKSKNIFFSTFSRSSVKREA